MMMSAFDDPAADLFRVLPVPGEDALAPLRERLVTEAASTGLLDVAYRVVDTPVGTLLVAATERGLVRVAFDREDHEAVMLLLAERISPRILHAPGRLDDVARQLEEYFTMRRRRFELPLDLRLSKGFRRMVLTHLTGIAYGRTESYTQVAAAVGSPKAARAVGSACATNPLPIVVPCHRVLRSDGSYDNYLGGPAAKRTLLTMEAA